MRRANFFTCFLLLKRKLIIPKQSLCRSTYSKLIKPLVIQEYTLNNKAEFIAEDVALLERNRIITMDDWIKLSERRKDKYPDALATLLDEHMSNEQVVPHQTRETIWAGTTDGPRKLVYESVPITVGSFGSEPGQLINPFGVTAWSGKIFVSDMGNHRVQVFDYKLQFLYCIGRHGNDDGEFNFPHGVVIDQESNLVVCDYKNHRIQVFDATTGKFIRKFGSSSAQRTEGRFVLPSGISIDSENNYFICDNTCVQKFKSDGTYVNHFECDSTPGGISVDNSNLVYISDRERNKILVLNSEGKLERTIGKTGSDDGLFQSPEGLKHDALTGNLMVSDFDNKRVQVLNSRDGSFIAKVGDNSTLSCAINTAILEDGSILVVDMFQNRLNLFIPKK